jgi:hypothetical protein
MTFLQLGEAMVSIWVKFQSGEQERAMSLFESPVLMSTGVTRHTI